MPANYVLLQRIELNASASSISFTNIPQSGYTDLKLVMSVRTTRSSTDDLINVNFNGVSTNQSSRWLQGNGTSASSGTYGSNLYLAWVNAASNTANTFGNAEMYIPNYTSANFKSISTDGVFENNATLALAGLTAGLWSSTAAITSITLTSVFSASFVQYSTFSLYGLAAVGTTPVIAPKATGGNITSDGTYWIHTFNSTGTFTPLQGLSCDYLVVAGGGGGGFDGGGGGGAGGLRSTVGATGGGGSLESALSLASGTAYTVTIGGGGAGSTSGSATGGAGSNSVFSTITSSGGGGGGSDSLAQGANGGSGGGSRGNRGALSGGTGTTNQGYAGGGADFGTDGGGGGGAGQAGAPGIASWQSGAGGNGVQTSITGTSTYYGGGGGGGDGGTAPGGAAGGLGGGGAGGSGTSTNPVAGTTNTGGGGGGGKGSSGLNGAAGGSGIVIVRYPIA